MKIRVNQKVLCIPPYISTTWHNVSSLHVEEEDGIDSHLVVTLLDDSQVRIPNLSKEAVHTIFNLHLKFLEQEEVSSSTIQAPSSQKRSANPFEASHPFSAISHLFPADQSIGLPLRFGAGGLESIGASLQHNPAQAEAPDLPAEIITKIAAIAKIVGADEGMVAPKAEANCNCLHCQIARAIHRAVEPSAEIPEELVSDEDLRFRLWDIVQESAQMYLVSNPMDNMEKYHVYLGEPLGCTCGNSRCAHIEAVLKT